MLIECRPVPTFSIDSLEPVVAAFTGATPIPLGQSWLQTPERDFAPGVVLTAWRAETLLVFANLTDADVFTLANRHNQRFWELGDTFEIFLQPEGDSAYVELHVAPNNLRLQLRFEKPPTARDLDPFAAALIHHDTFDSRTWTSPNGDGWLALAVIPIGTMFNRPLAGSTWRFSFSRYDATRGRERPVISSSSPHAELAFHRPHEWQRLRFSPAQRDRMLTETPPR